MAVIDLNLAMTYCPNWGTWEGIRELVQNAVDGDEEGCAMAIEYSPRTNLLRIINRSVVLPESALVMGYSFKGENARGKHGEGLKVGLLALVRAGHDVTILNGKESWRPEIVPRGNLSVLGVRTRALGNNRSDLSIEVSHVSPELWAVYSRMFLFVSPPADRTVLHVGKDRLLLAPEYAGHVFCRGIFVCRVRNLRCGYEIPSLNLDRDRGMIESWDLRSRLAELWETACQQHPDRAVPALYDAMSTGPSEELRAADTGTAMKAVGRELRAEMRRRRGEKAIAVSSAGTADRMRQAGLEPVSLPQQMIDLMEQDGETAASIELAHREHVEEYIDVGMLSNDECAALCTLNRLVGPPYLSVVRFTDPAVCAKREGLERVLVDRSLLSLPLRKSAVFVVAAESTRSGRAMSDIYLEALFPDVKPAIRPDGGGALRGAEPRGAEAVVQERSRADGAELRSDVGGSGESAGALPD